MPKFIEWLKSENKTTINKIYVYIFKSFQKRNKIFYSALVCFSPLHSRTSLVGVIYLFIYLSIYLFIYLFIQF